MVRGQEVSVTPPERCWRLNHLPLASNELIDEASVKPKSLGLESFSVGGDLRGVETHRSSTPLPHTLPYASLPSGWSRLCSFITKQCSSK